MSKYNTLLARNENRNSGHLLELLYHLAVVLNHSKCDFVVLFKALARNPQVLQVSKTFVNITMQIFAIYPF